MKKIPVGNVVRYAYSFTFGHLGAIIGLSWLPFVLVALLNFLPYLWGGRSFSQLSGSNPATGGLFALADLAVSFATLLFYAMAYVSVTELALGLRPDRANIYLSFGRPVWKMFGAFLLLLLLAALFVLILMAWVGSVEWITGRMLPKPAAAGISGIAVIVGLCALLYILLRLAFFLAPVTVAEERIDIGRSWMLTRGNFWRILAISVAVFAPILIIAVLAAYAIMGHDLSLAAQVNPQTAPALFQQRMQAVSRHTPAMMGVSLVLAPFSLGLVLGAQAFAYRLLVPPGNAGLSQR